MFPRLLLQEGGAGGGAGEEQGREGRGRAGEEDRGGPCALGCFLLLSRLLLRARFFAAGFFSFAFHHRAAELVPDSGGEVADGEDLFFSFVFGRGEKQKKGEKTGEFFDDFPTRFLILSKKLKQKGNDSHPEQRSVVASRVPQELELRLEAGPGLDLR